MPRRRRRQRVAGREGLGDGLVVRVSVVDAEARQGVEERLLRVAEWHAVLRAPRSRERGLDRREIELDHLRVRRRLVRIVPERILLAVRLHERDLTLRPPGEAQVAQCLVVHGEEAARRPVLGRHVPDRRSICERKPLQAVPEVLDELPDDACFSQDLVTVSTRSVAVEPSGSLPVSLNPTTCGTSIEIASPSIAASASMPPTPQPSTPSPLIIVVCESVPTSVSGNATPPRSSTTRARNSRLT